MKKSTITTPKGRANWPKLSVVEYKFDEDGVHTCDLIVSKEDADAFGEVLREYAEANRADAYVKGGTGGAPAGVEPTLPIREHRDKEKKPTGDWVIRTKMKAFFKDRDTGQKVATPPTFIDAKKNHIRPAPMVGGGSTLVLGCQIRLSYVQGNYYVTLAPKVVQVLELVELGGANVESYGFDEMEGFVAPEDLGSIAAPSAATSGDGTPNF